MLGLFQLIGITLFFGGLSFLYSYIGAVAFPILFFSVPIVTVIFFIISLCRYISAKRKNRLSPGTFPPEEIRKRKIILIVSAVIIAVLIAIVAGISYLLFTAIAFM